MSSRLFKNAIVRALENNNERMCCQKSDPCIRAKISGIGIGRILKVSSKKICGERLFRFPKKRLGGEISAFSPRCDHK